jgi:ABC-type lipoprotein export system ATPase subunit
VPTDLAAECRDLVQMYPAAGGAVLALGGVAARFPTGSTTVVIGPSGAGKSTFLRLVACLERPAAGEVWVDGRATTMLRARARRRIATRRIGYVFQRPADNLLEYLGVRAHLVLALRMRGEHGAAADRLLATAGLAGVADRRVSSLSAGEQQRLAFAMAVAGDPSLVVADEPTAELDPDATAALVASLPAYADAGQTFLISSHDPAVIEVADQLLVIRRGTLAARAARAGEEPLAVIDDAGRVQLPDDAVDLFPDRRVRLSVVDGRVRIDEP